MLLKEKENKILMLKQQLEQEKSNQQVEFQIAKLQLEFEQMQIKHQASLAEKEAQIQELIDKYKDNQNIYQFIIEALSLNSQLMHQKEILCQTVSQLSPYCETSDKLTSQVIDMRLKYDEVLKRISNFITWQNSEDGRKANFPILEESHKEILFTDWDSRLGQAEKATAVTAATTNTVIENINENLHSANLVAKSIPGFLPNVKHLKQPWRQAIGEKQEAIRKMTKLNWEAYWQYLVKPQSHWMTL